MKFTNMVKAVDVIVTKCVEVTSLSNIADNIGLGLGGFLAKVLTVFPYTVEFPSPSSKIY